MKPILTIKSFLVGSFLLICFFTACKKTDLSEPMAKAPTTAVGNAQTAVMDALKTNSNKWIINTFAGSDVHGYAGDGGLVRNALLNGPQNVYVDKRGDVYITDFGNNVFRKVDGTTGIITTIAGNGNNGFSGDGGPATQASFSNAFHTATDDMGNLYISDLSNSRIRRVERNSGIVKTIAGTGLTEFNGDGKTALETNLNIPFGLAFDKEGNLLFSDGAGLRLRKMNMRTKIITTVAGNGNQGFGGDGGPATQAMFSGIWNVTVDQNSGDIYVSDQSNYRIRKINPSSGIITTVAGNGIPGNSGMGGPAINASFTQPVGIAVGKNGDLFISDQVLSQVYVVDKKTGIINLVAGNGTNGFFGDGGPSINALLSWTNSLSVDPAGNLYINDLNNNRVRIIKIVGGVN
jgi:trimeric autotransporter adhesin